MIIGIGTDILQLARLQAWPLRRLQRLSSRILTPNEMRLLESIKGLHSADLLGNNHRESVHTSKDPQWPEEMDAMIRFLGVRWAAKESLYKAVCPYHRLCWKDVELLPIGKGANTREDGGSDPNRSNGSKLQATFITPLRLTVDDSTIPFLKTHMSISHDGGLVVAMAVVEGA